MSKDIKVLILDIDGTISGKSNQVTARVKEAIKQVQSKGIKVGLATGRMYCSALRFHYDIGADLPIIGYNGAWMQNPLTSEILFHQPVEKTIARQLLKYLQKKQDNTDLEVHLYFDDRLYVEEFTTNTDFYVKRSGVDAQVRESLDSLLENHPTKLLALSNDAQLISFLLTDLQKLYPHQDELYLTQSNPMYLEATHASVSKGATVKYLVEKILGYSANELMTMGDNFNDSTMLEYAGLGVAMGNAPEGVKQIAQEVTSTVEEDGVAEAIDRFLL